MASHPIRRRRRPDWPLDRVSVAGALLLALTVLGPAPALARPPQEQAGRPPGEPVATAPALRAQDDTAEAIVADALRLSPTVTDLVQRLEAAAVIVMVRTADGLPWTTGELRLIARTPVCRFLLIRLERHRRRDDQIALLGHELQHAVEVAADPSVVDAETLVNLYRRIGLRTTRPDHYETRAAVMVQWQVAREVYEARRVAKKAAKGGGTGTSATGPGQAHRSAEAASETAPI